MPKALFAQDFMEMPCSHCGQVDCDDGPLHLGARCHPEAGQKVEYHKKDNTLVFSCNECGLFCGAAYVATDPDRMAFSG